MIAGGILLAQHRNMMVRAVHGRTHQIGGTGIHTDVFFIGVLFVDGFRHQTAIGTQQEPAQLGENGHIAHPRRDQNFLISLPDAFTDDGNIIFRLFGTVGDADAAGQIDKGNVTARFPLQFHGSLEQNPGQRRVIFIGNGVGGQERMEAEPFGPQGFELGERFRQLGPGHAVLGLAGVVHDLEALLAFAQLEHAAGIVAAGDGLRDKAQGALQKVHMGQIVQIDGGAQFGGQLKFLSRGVVGGKHDVAAGEATAVRHHQLRQRGTVGTAALLLQNLQNLRIGRGLDSEIFPKAGIPGKGGPETAGTVPDTGFVVQIKGGGVCFHDVLHLGQGDKGRLHGRNSCL